MVTELYNDMDERAKKVADMDRKTRANVVWDLAEEFKVTLIYTLLMILLDEENRSKGGGEYN